jgi:solute carrier family 25 citrate transporter 1
MSPSKHPVTAGWLAGTFEIVFTYPLEFVKTQLQLQQRASTINAGRSTGGYTSSMQCFTRTVSERGVLGLYRGGSAWVVFAGPRSAVRFSVFHQLSALAHSRGHTGRGTDTVCGFFAGVAEAALCQTPNQAISIKMVHDQAPNGPKRFTSLAHAVRVIYTEAGVIKGFFCGLTPAVVKGAVTNCVRFLGYGAMTRTMSARLPPDQHVLSPWQTMLAGGVAGSVSAVISQPIDTVKANMMGLEAARFDSSLGCVRELVRAGGVRCLFNGVGPRAARVFVEVGLQFTMFDVIGRKLDSWLL